MSRDQVFDVIPGCGIEGIDAYIPFRIGFPFQQVFGIGDAGTVDECQSDVVGHDESLTYPCAHMAAAIGIEIGQSLAVKIHRR